MDKKGRGLMSLAQESFGTMPRARRSTWDQRLCFQWLSHQPSERNCPTVAAVRLRGAWFRSGAV